MSYVERQHRSEEALLRSEVGGVLEQRGALTLMDSRLSKVNSMRTSRLAGLWGTIRA